MTTMTKRRGPPRVLVGLMALQLAGACGGDDTDPVADGTEGDTDPGEGTTSNTNAETTVDQEETSDPDETGTSTGDPVEPTLDDELRELLDAQGVEPVTPPPEQDPALVALGQQLFFDKELSGRRNISCATCHHPLLGTSDAQSQSRGQGATGLGPAREHGPNSLFLARNTLSLWNRGVVGWDVMFWDGRLGGNPDEGYISPAGDDTPQGFSNALAEFLIIPITPDEEMRGFPGELDVFGQVNEMADLTNDDFAEIWPLVVDRALGVDEYRDQLTEIFGVPEDEINVVHLGEAAGAFMIDAFTFLDSPFDRYLAGDDSALSNAAKRGGILFYGRASCSNCHTGGLQTDLGFHNVAAPQVGTGKGDEAPLDFGRGRVTGNAEDNFQFRTPSLRNIELEGPWMHNGAYADLEGHGAPPPRPGVCALVLRRLPGRARAGGHLPERRRDHGHAAGHDRSPARGGGRPADRGRDLGSYGVHLRADRSQLAQPAAPGPRQRGQRAAGGRLIAR